MSVFRSHWDGGEEHAEIERFIGICKTIGEVLWSMYVVWCVIAVTLFELQFLIEG